MNLSLGQLRVAAQGLIDRPFARPADAVSAFGAMQGQDLPGVIASAALRSTGQASDVVADLDAGRIVRGYPMRGTVFFLPADDALWVTQLCANPSLRANNRPDIDDAVLGRAFDVGAALLDDGPRGRATVLEAWESAGISTGDGRGYHLLFRLMASGRLCYGPWNGSEQDLVLAESWLPAGSSLQERFDGDRTAATAALLQRYFAARGPATVRDFAWWTKLTLSEIRRALPLLQGIESDAEAEASYWRAGLPDEAAALGRAVDRPLLLPGFDEFILGYQDRLFALSPHEHSRLVPGNNGVFQRSVVIGGKVRGLWRRGGRPGRRTFEVDEFKPLSAANRKRLDRLFAEFPFVND